MAKYKRELPEVINLDSRNRGRRKVEQTDGASPNRQLVCVFENMEIDLEVRDSDGHGFYIQNGCPRLDGIDGIVQILQRVASV